MPCNVLALIGLTYLHVLGCKILGPGLPFSLVCVFLKSLKDLYALYLSEIDLMPVYHIGFLCGFYNNRFNG